MHNRLDNAPKVLCQRFLKEAILVLVAGIFVVATVDQVSAVLPEFFGPGFATVRVVAVQVMVLVFAHRE